jgi:cytochrome c oxidase accessory protein FixG
MSEMQNQSSKPDNDVERGFYKKREKIFPREVKGPFTRLRYIAMFVLLGLYYFLPYLRWGDRQAVLFDLPARKFYIFNLTFWPQDFIYLSALLIISALALFFFTALAGRLWCGYACPQTVWTEVFFWFERKIDGSRQEQIKLEKAPMSGQKLMKRFAKHFIWLAFSLWTGFTFVGWFTPIDELWHSVLTNNLGPWETFWILFYSFATYGNAGWFREQMCIYMCPYARFQSAMFDKDTMLIAYDEKRGEPRGGRHKSEDPAKLGLGSCIDCKLCVQVCPTGIDIRNGLQYQCIGCAACIDVCNDVMDQMGYERDLIKYTTEHALHNETTHVIRPRMIVYGMLLAVITSALLYSMFTRIPLEVDIIRDRNALYLETDNGLIENVYNLKVLNMMEKPQTYSLSISGLEGAELIVANAKSEFSVEAGKVLELPLRVRIDPVNLKSISNSIEFHVKSLTTEGVEKTEEGRFLGPRV